jgi:hypothetical protein
MKTFEMPKAEIIALEAADIITTSPPEWSTSTDRIYG